MRVLLKIMPFVLLIMVVVSCKKDERAFVVGKIQKASDLATTEFTVDKLVYGSKTKKVAWVFTLRDAKFLAYSKAHIKTGVELGKLTEKDIVVKDKMISLTLPPVKVVNFSYPPDSFHLDPEISNPNQFLNRITIEEQEELFRQAELDIRNNLQYMGVVKTTQQNTRNILTRLLAGLGYEEIYINFKDDNLLVDEVNLNLSE